MTSPLARESPPRRFSMWVRFELESMNGFVEDCCWSWIASSSWSMYCWNSLVVSSKAASTKAFAAASRMACMFLSRGMLDLRIEEEGVSRKGVSQKKQYGMALDSTANVPRPFLGLSLARPRPDRGRAVCAYRFSDRQTDREKQRWCKKILQRKKDVSYVNSEGCATNSTTNKRRLNFRRICTK